MKGKDKSPLMHFFKLSYEIQYVTKVSTPLTFLQILDYIFAWDNTEEMTLYYNVK